MEHIFTYLLDSFVLGMRPPMPPTGARPPFMGGPPMVPQMGQPMPPPPPRPPMPTQRPMDDDEPLSKKARTEEQLIPENDFLAMHKASATRSQSRFLLGYARGKCY